MFATYAPTKDDSVGYRSVTKALYDIVLYKSASTISVLLYCMWRTPFPGWTGFIDNTGSWMFFMGLNADTVPSGLSWVGDLCTVWIRHVIVIFSFWTVELTAQLPDISRLWIRDCVCCIVHVTVNMTSLWILWCPFCCDKTFNSTTQWNGSKGIEQIHGLYLYLRYALRQSSQ